VGITKFKLKVETPTNVGSGAMEPRYLIRKSKDGKFLKIFDANTVIDYLVQNKMTKSIEYLKSGERTIEFPDNLKHRKLSIYNPSNFRETMLNTFIRNSQGPYIPGSTIKGALKLAFLFHDASESLINQLLQINYGRNKNKELFDRTKVLVTHSKAVKELKNFEKRFIELFQFIKISDVQFSEDDLCAVQVTRGSPMTFECLKPGAEGTVRIIFDELIDQLEFNFDHREFLNRVFDFYKKVKEFENKQKFLNIKKGNLKIGRTGVHSKTLFLKVIQLPGSLSERYLRLFPRPRKSVRTRDDPLKTFYRVGNMPLGWVTLEELV